MTKIDYILKWFLVIVTSICWFPIFLGAGILGAITAHFEWCMKTWHFVMDPIIEYEGED